MRLGAVSSHRAESLASELKEEKVTLKTLRTELQQLQEELFDTKNEKEVVEKVGVALVGVALVRRKPFPSKCPNHKLISEPQNPLCVL